MSSKTKLKIKKNSLFSFSLQAPLSRYLALLISSIPSLTSSSDLESLHAARTPSKEGKGKGSQAKKRGGGRGCREEEEERRKARAQEIATSNAEVTEAARRSFLRLHPIRWKQESAAKTEDPARDAAARASRRREREEGKRRSESEEPLATRRARPKLDAARTSVKERDWKRAWRWEASSSFDTSSSCCSSVRRGGEEEAGEEACFR